MAMAMAICRTNRLLLLLFKERSSAAISAAPPSLSYSSLASLYGWREGPDKRPTVRPPIKDWPVHLYPRLLYNIIKKAESTKLALTIFNYAGKHHYNYRHSSLTYLKIIERLLGELEFTKVEEVLGQLRKEKFYPSESIFIRVIRGYGYANKPDEAEHMFRTIPLYKRCKQSHATFNVLLSVLFSTKNYDRVYNLYHSCGTFGLRPNVMSCNMFIKSLCKQGYLALAKQVYANMPRLGFAPTPVTYVALMEGHCEAGDMAVARKIFDYTLRKGILLRPSDYNSLIDGYCKAGNLDEALKIGKNMSDKGVEKLDLTYALLIEGLCDKNRFDEALELFYELIDKWNVFQESSRLCCVVLGGMCKVGRVEEAAKLWEELLDKGCLPHSDVYETLIHWLFKIGDIKKGKRLFQDMCNQDVATVSGYNVMIRGLCEVGQLQEACKVWDGMLMTDLVPDESSYAWLILGFCQAGMAKEGVEILLDMMLSMDLVPNVSLFRKVMPGFSTLSSEQACTLLEEILYRNVCPDPDVVDALFKKLLDERSLFIATKIFHAIWTDSA